MWRMLLVARARAFRAALYAVLACAAVLGLGIVSAPPAAAATLHLTDPDARLDLSQWFPNPGCNLTLDGEIFPGDFETIEAQYNAHMEAWGKLSDIADRGAGTSVFTLCLTGGVGGDLGEAIKIANLFSGWNTVVQSGEACVSACAIVFMRALDGMTLFDWPNFVTKSKRYLHWNATLGFHAPRLVIPKAVPKEAAGSEGAAKGADGDRITIEEAHGLAGEMYDRALASTRAVILGSDKGPTGLDAEGPAEPGEAPKRRSFVGFGQFGRSKLPLELLLAFLVTPPGEMFEVATINEAQHWGIDIVGVEPPKVLSATMLLNACFNTLYTRCQQGQTNAQCFFESDGIDTSTVSDTSAWNLDAIKDMLSNFEWDTVSAWPPKGVASTEAVMALRLRDNAHLRKGWDKRFGPNLHRCGIRLYWNNGRLGDAELHTSNGDALEFVLPEMKIDAKGVAALRDNVAKGIFSSDRLQPWRMLPSGMLLKSLGNNPWGAMAKEANVFGRPPGW